MRPNPFDDDLQKLRTQIAFQDETIGMLREYGQSTSSAEKDLKRLQEDLTLLHEIEQSRDLPGGRLRKTLSELIGTGLLFFHYMCGDSPGLPGHCCCLWLLHFPPQRRAGFLSKTPGTGRQILRFVVGDIPSHGRRRLPALRFGRRTRRLGCPLRTLAAVAQCSAGRAFCSRLRNSFPTTWLCRSGSQTPCLRCRARPGILTAISCRGGLMNFTHLHYCS